MHQKEMETSFHLSIAVLDTSRYELNMPLVQFACKWVHVTLSTL